MKKTSFAKLFSESYFQVCRKYGIYACPLCFKEFAIGDADELTWDHYPHQNIGGKFKVLICKICRDKWDRIDAEMNKVKIKGEFRHKFPEHIPVIMQFDDIPGLRHRAALKSSSRSMELHPRLTYDGGTKYLSKYLSYVYQNQVWDGIRGNIKYDNMYSIKSQTVEKAIFKSAYLAIFNSFGYAYLLSDIFSAIRIFVNAPQSDCPSILITYSATTEHRQQINFSYIYDPPDMAGLGVEVYTPNIKIRWFMIFPIPYMDNVPKLKSNSSLGKFLKCVHFKPNISCICDTDIKVTDNTGKMYPIYKALLSDRGEGQRY